MSDLRRLTWVALLAWLAMLGFDFLLHAGVLAELYRQPSPFLLPPARAFALIPVGYLSFLFFAVMVVWLMARLNVTGWRAGALFGLKLGALTWGGLALGLLSISTAEPSLLLGWFVGQTLELGLAGAVVGSALAGARLSRLVWGVIVLVVLSIMGGIALQNLAPAMPVLW